MRINKYIASTTSLSRRAADTAIAEGRVLLNGQVADTGSQVSDDGNDQVMLDGTLLQAANQTAVTIMLNKPPDYVVSRNGQGSATIYDLLPPEYQNLNPVGRLDKDSSGLLLLTNDGDLANQLTHPRYQKTKIYEVWLSAPLQPLHQQMINDHGITLNDGLSKLQLAKLNDASRAWQITMHQGRNRQIRRTFAALGYTVTTLHRIQFGNYRLGNLDSGQYAANT